MKKPIIYILIFSILFSSFSVTTANAAETSTEIEYLENGDYIETSITIYPQTRDNTTKVTATKTSTFKNADNEVLWWVSITATFFYLPGRSCNCTVFKGSAEAVSSNWKVSDITSSKSGNTATVSAKGTHYMAFLPLHSLVETITLTCDVYGNLF